MSTTLAAAVGGLRSDRDQVVRPSESVALSMTSLTPRPCVPVAQVLDWARRVALDYRW